VPLVLAGLLVPAATLAAPTVPTFNAQIGGCFGGKVPVAGATVSVSWHDHSGKLKGSFTAHADSSGFWTPPAGTCNRQRVHPLDTLSARMGGSNPMQRTFAVPSLQMTFNRDSNVVAGVGPPNATLQMVVTGDELVITDDVCFTSVTTNSAGQFLLDTEDCRPGYDVRGGDSALADWTTAAGDVVSLTVVAPYIQLLQGTATVRGAAGPSAAVAVALRTSAFALRAGLSLEADLHGRWGGHLHTAAGSPVIPGPGNIVQGNWAGFVQFPVSHLSIAFNTATDTVQGTCMKFARYGLEIDQADGTLVEGRGSTTNSIGDTDLIDTSAIHHLVAGDVITLTCERASGDRFRLVKVVS
jgi:hypothetical protein